MYSHYILMKRIYKYIHIVKIDLYWEILETLERKFEPLIVG